MTLNVRPFVLHTGLGDYVWIAMSQACAIVPFLKCISITFFRAHFTTMSQN
jgi:hypothetical protein